MRVQQPGSKALRLVLSVLAVVIVSGEDVSLLKSPPVMAASEIARSSPIDGQWTGFWVSFSSESQGYLYEATMTLRSDAESSVDGQINWTLRISPRAAEQAKIGLSGVEFVRGSYDPGSRVIRLTGYRKDDPNTVIGLDRYHLVLADNGRVIGGITESHGSWQGLLSTTLEKP